MSRSRQLRFIDLFAGGGGLALGFQKASDKTVSFRSVFAVECDPSAAATYAANFKHEVFTAPIENLGEADLPQADLVIGGPPCQGFSPLGRFYPTDHHPRLNELWKRYFEVVKVIRPLAFVMENVPEFLRSVEFEEVWSISDTLGYDIKPGILHAVEFGVPQRRRRGFIVGLRKGHEQSTAWLPEPRGTKRIQAVRDAIWDLRDAPLVYDFKNGKLPDGRFRPHKARDLHIGRNPTRKSLERYACIPPGGNRFNLMKARPDLTPRCWKKKTGSTDVMGRLEWDEPALTIRTEFFKPEKGRYLHPEADRPITHREAARLQTFPDNYIFCGSKIDIARQIGNAVPPRLAKAVAQHLKSILS